MAEVIVVMEEKRKMEEKKRKMEEEDQAQDRAGGKAQDGGAPKRSSWTHGGACTHDEERKTCQDLDTRTRPGLFGMSVYEFLDSF